MRKVISFSELQPFCYFHNRTVFENGSLHLSFPASGFTIRFSGNGARICFDHYQQENHDPCYVTVILDGKSQRFPIATGTEVLPLEDLCEGEHTLTCLRNNEVRSPELPTFLSISTLIIDGSNPALLPAPERKAHRMLFLGDSITCGWGVRTPPIEGYTYRPQDADVTMAYAYRTAMAFDADYQILAASGQGIVKNCGAETGYRIPVLFHDREYNGRPYDFTEFSPQVVVINAGTNDCGGHVAVSEFIDGAQSFLHEIRSIYPDAEIIWTLGLMGNAYADGLQALFASQQTDAHMHYLPMKALDAKQAEIGGCGHPSIQGQTRCASLLCEKIAALTGWSYHKDI